MRVTVAVCSLPLLFALGLLAVVAFTVLALGMIFFKLVALAADGLYRLVQKSYTD